MDRPIPWWIRAHCLMVAPQALVFIIDFFLPGSVQFLGPWPASPLNARFIASLYTAVGLGVLLCSTSRNFHQARLVLFGIGLATGMLFVITLYRWNELDHFPLFWMLFYKLTPGSALHEIDQGLQII
jgi:hypothetical protein